MSDAPSKICVICGLDCAGQPRIKNDKGQYAHKACVAKKQTPEPDPYALDDDALAMDDLLGDIDQAPETPAMRTACPSCGSALADGAVICMNCGHNTQSGKKLTSKVITPKDPGAATAVAAKAGGVAALPVLWAIGGVIGGAVGALREDIAYERERAMDEFTSMMSDAITEEGFKSSFSPFDLLWAFLAVGAAFAVASGEGFSFMD